MVSYMSEETELARWLRQQFGPNQRFKSARHLSLAAGLSQNMVNLIIERGGAGPETLIKLAELLEVPVERLFVKAGWLKDESLDTGSTWELSEDEVELLQGYRELPQEGRAWLIGSLRGMQQFARGSN
jgi:transcriptional regulator with XRE-family HTH domain